MSGERPVAVGWVRDPWRDSVRPPLSWRVARVMSWGFAGAAIGVALAWLAGRVLTDRTILTQYLFWVPAEFLVVGFLVLALVAGALRRMARKRRRWWRIAAVAMGVVMVGHLALVRYRVPMGLLRRAEPAGSIAIGHWNAATVWRREEILAALAKMDVDVLIVSNPDWNTDWGALAAEGAFAARLQARSQSWGPVSRFTRVGEFGVISAWPIARAGMTTLGIESAGADIDELVPLDRRSSRRDPGRAMFVEFGGSGVPRLVIWGLDMPSDPRLWRWPMAERASEMIRGFRGEQLVWRGEGSERERVREAIVGGFPTPDVVIGDFNTPRGAASLGLIVPAGFVNAFDEAGVGDGATWPRRVPWEVRPRWWPRWPMFQIDHTFVGPGLRVWRYQLIDPGGSGSHVMQRVVVGEAGK